MKILSLPIFLSFTIPILFGLTPANAEDTETDTKLWQPYYVSPRHGKQHLDLGSDWALNHAPTRIIGLEELPEDGWINVHRPSTVHRALEKAGVLPDPYAHLNSQQYEWVEDAVWYYRRTFELDQLPESGFAILVFDGIDYLARIWLNGEYLGEHEGMFGGPAIGVDQWLNQGKNEIIVEVHSGKEFRAKGWPGRRNPDKVIKGWEFTGGVGAEPFYTVGMWQGVRLEFVPEIHIERPHLVTESVVGGQARMTLSTEVYEGSHSLDYTLHPLHGIQNHPNHGRYTYATYMREKLPVEAQLRIDFHNGNILEHSQTWPVDIFNQRTWINREFSIDNPRLWWPNGMGSPELYQVTVSLMIDGCVADRISFDYGIRTITTERSSGPQVGDYWENWQFLVNGRPFFVKGVNWMPADLLLELPQEEYDWLVGLGREAGMQMFRIWGAGLIETEEFYNACNRAGILVWAEYSMANWDAEHFPQDVYEAQVMWTLYRLRNHPSLAVHAGGNEYNPYSIANTPLTGILERAVATFDRDAIYRRASPDGGSMHAYDDTDATWWSKTYKYTPFMAETGLHSITEAESLYEIIDPREFGDLENLYNDSFKENHPEFLHHFVEFQANRVPRMMSRASHMMDMRSPTIEELAEASQVAAGEWYQVISEQMQANYPVTTGLLPWTFKRPWPVVSAIHLIDGFGQPSAPYYFLKRTYTPTHVILEMDHTLRAPGEAFPLKVAIIHASTARKEPLDLTLRILDDSFNTLTTRKYAIDGLNPGPSVTRHHFPEPFTIPETWQDRYFFVTAELTDPEGGLISRSVYWPRSLVMLGDPEFQTEYRSKPQPWPNLAEGPWLRDVVSKKPTRIEAKLLQSDSSNGQSVFSIRIQNSGPVPAFMTQLNVAGAKRRFVTTDNYFWLAPGEERTIHGTIDWREDVSAQSPLISIAAWNAAPVEIPLMIIQDGKGPN